MLCGMIIISVLSCQNRNGEIEMRLLDLENVNKNVDVITLGLRCTKCGRLWGVSVKDFTEFKEIPYRKFNCLYCETKKETD